MRPLLMLIALVMILAPLAGAQPTAARGPSLLLEPARLDAAPGASVNVTAVLTNPLDQPVTWSLSYRSPSGPTVTFARTEVTVAALSRERVDATISLPDRAGITHNVTLAALETPASARAAGRVAQLRLQENATIHVAGASDALPPPALELRIEPAPVVLPRQGNATARLFVFNKGPAIDAPSFDVRAPDGIRVSIDTPASLPTNARTEIVVRFEHLGDEPVGTLIEVGIGVHAHRATTNFRVEIRAPAQGVVGAAAVALPEDLPIETPVIAAAAVAAVGAAWVGLWLTRHKWWPLLAALYTRLKPSGILDHPVRKRLTQVVQDTPGITFGELARRLDIAPGQLTHHARMLEKAGVVFSSPDGQTRRFFHVGHGRLQAVPPLAERALALVREQPRHASALAKELGVSRQALHYHVQKLVAQGELVARTEDHELWLEAPAATSRLS